MQKGKYPSGKVSVPVAKIEDYLLNPEKVHSAEFFEAGYTLADGLRLFQDMEKQFDEEKALKRKTLANGFEEFVIYMSLGVNKKRTFRTVWRRDDMDIRPRFITAYRDKEGEQYVGGI